MYRLAEGYGGEGKGVARADRCPRPERYWVTRLHVLGSQHVGKHVLPGRCLASLLTCALVDAFRTLCVLSLMPTYKACYKDHPSWYRRLVIVTLCNGDDNGKGPNFLKIHSEAYSKDRGSEGIRADVYLQDA